MLHGRRSYCRKSLREKVIVLKLRRKRHAQHWKLKSDLRQISRAPFRDRILRHLMAVHSAICGGNFCTGVADFSAHSEKSAFRTRSSIRGEYSRHTVTAADLKASSAPPTHSCSASNQRRHSQPTGRHLGEHEQKRMSFLRKTSLRIKETILGKHRDRKHMQPIIIPEEVVKLGKHLFDSDHSLKKIVF